MSSRIVAQEVTERYLRDGAVCLRGLFADWVETLRAGVERNMREPGPYAAENLNPGEEGRFFDDYCNWTRIPEFEAFIRKSSAAQVAAEVMGSRTAQFFHDHVLVKEPGTAKHTPWHQDIPYYCVEGMQTVSAWVVLDPVPAESSLRMVAGSHLWPKMLKPLKWLNEIDFYEGETTFMSLPDIEGEPETYRVLVWDMEPGDAVFFNYRTVHGARGNLGQSRRRAFSHRWLGEDVRFCERPGRTSPPFPGINQKSGERLREDWFPVLWSA